MIILKETQNHKIQLNGKSFAKSKLNLLAPSGECPISLRPPLDSIVYASKKLNIDELNQLREKISKMYGEDYIKKASNNEDQIVNQELIQKLNETIPEETIKKKLTTFIKATTATVIPDITPIVVIKSGLICFNIFDVFDKKSSTP